MIRALACLLAILLLVGTLVACGQKANGTDNGALSTTDTTTGTTLSSTTTADPAGDTDDSSSVSKKTTATVRTTVIPSNKPTVSVLTPPKTTASITANKTTTKKTTTTKPITGQALVAIDEDDYYGRSLLSGDLRKAYDRIADAVEDLDTSVSLADLSVPKDEIMRIMQYYRDDYPQHFYLDDDDISFSHTGTKVHTLTLHYTMSKSDVAAAKAKVEKAVDKLLEGIHGGMTAYERERLIYRRLIQHVTYNKKGGTAIYDLYGALVNRQAVCDGYAHALQYLLYRAGIPCIRVTGSSKGESHVWNMVKLSNKWYYVDVTWDDPIVTDVTDFVGYTYLNVTEAQIKQDHNIEPIKQDGQTISYSLPAATATDYNYFRQTGPTLSSFQYSKVLAHCRSVAADGDLWVGFKVTGSVNSFIEAFGEHYFDLQADVSGCFTLQYIQSIEPVDGIIYIYIK